MKRALIALPAILFAFWPYQAQAEPLPGLNAIGYTYQPTEIPTRSDDLYPTCGSEIENNINRNFNGEPFQSCGWDFFMVHYSGYITIPEHDIIRFMVAADDGGTVSIAGTEFGTWNLKGCLAHVGFWKNVASQSLENLEALRTPVVKKLKNSFWNLEIFQERISNDSHRHPQLKPWSVVGTRSEL